METMKDYEILPEWNPWESIDDIPDEPTYEECAVVFRQLKETQRRLHTAMQIMDNGSVVLPADQGAWRPFETASDNAYHYGEAMLQSIDAWGRTEGNGVSNLIWDQFTHVIDDILMEEMDEERKQRIREHNQS